MTDINICDSEENTVYSWELSYDYFNDSIANLTDENKHLFKRLRLSDIRRKYSSQEPYKFHYYDSVSLPVKNTMNLDYWGYYNGVNQGENYYCPTSETIISSNKSANESYGKMGILESIEFPTGGVANLYWESNTVSNGEKRGGLRIAKIEGEKEVSYQYEGGKDLIQPSVYYIERLIGDDFDVVCRIQPSESVRQLSTLKNGNIVGYSKVTEFLSDNSKTEYVYHNEEEVLQDTFAYSPTWTDWSNGVLLKKTRLDPQGDTISIVSNSYNLITTTENFKMGFIERKTGTLFYYYGNAQCPQLSSSINTDFYKNGKRVTTETYTYNENFLCTEMNIQIGTDVQKHIYKYADDFSDLASQMMVDANMIGIPVAQWTFRNGTLNQGIRTIYDNFDELSADGNTVVCSIHTAKDDTFKGMILPKYELVLNTTNMINDIALCKYDTTIIYDSYTQFGRIRDLRYKGTPISYIWSYKGTYPIAELKNATYQEFTDAHGNLNFDMIGGFDQDAMTHLRNQIRNVCGLMDKVSVKTKFYKPLVGVVDVTDTRGIIYSYSYNVSNRISSIHLSSSSYFPTSEQIQSYTYGKNYVSSKKYLTWQSQSSIEGIQYYDEWGRPFVKASQGAKQDGTFSYAMQTYDLMGRPQRTYMSVPSNSTTGELIDVSAFQNLSLTAFSNDPFGYSQTSYDALERTTEITLPGKAWNENKKSTIMQHLTNTANEVKKYTASGNTLNEAGYYEAGTLECTQTTDPDGLTIKSYKDLFGNVVLERRASNFDTYYVYDNYNRLRFVLPPKYQEEKNLGYYAYQYEYDGRGRMVKKTLPGCEPIRYWYDKNDRLVKMQDGLLAQSDYYRIWGYDELGRAISQGIEYNGNLLYYEILNFYDDYGFIEDYSAYFPAAIDNSLPTSFYYGQKGSLTGTWQRATDGEGILIVVGYDDIGYLSKKTVSALNKFVLVSDYTNNLAGDVTEERFREYTYKASNGSMEKVISGVVNHNYGYQHTRLLTSSVLSLLDNSGNVLRTDTISKLTYDDFGRVKKNDRGGTKADMMYEYNPMYGWVNCIKSSGGFEQRLYRETEGNTPRWNGGISAMTWKTNNAYLRRFDYDYDSMNRLTNAEYSQYRITGGTSLSPTLSLLPVGMENEDYTSEYGYDKNSNLLYAYRQGVVDDVEEGLYYDTMDDYNVSYRGNQKLSVGGTGVGEPSYYGSSSFVDGADEAVEYAYNANGAMTMDLNKGITNIAYDLLGNLKEITFDNNRIIRYIYAADGTRLRMVHLQKKNGVWLKDSVDYSGYIRLNNGSLDKLHFIGGYLTLSGSGNANGCHYYIQDYQGSNRMVVNSNGVTEQATHYYPYGGVIGGIDLGSNLQPYKFEGKELDRTYGLDWYDIHARQYDPIVPAWHTVDPLCEKSYTWSPYAYCIGNPIDFIDPTGLAYWYTNNSKEIEKFMNHVKDGGGGGGDFDMSGWHYSSDADFLSNLFYNDQTGNFHYSYGTIENGEIVCHGRTFSKISSGGVGGLYSGVNTVADATGESLVKHSGNSTFGYNGKFYWHPKTEKGFDGNQHVSAVRLTKIGKGITKVTGPVGKVLDATNVIIGINKDIKHETNNGYNTVRAVGDVTGGLVIGELGTWGFVFIGMKTGFVAGPFGIIICGTIGGIIGSYVGSEMGTSIVDEMYNR